MSEFARPVAVDRIGPQGLEVVVEARPEELAPLAARLQIPAVARLRCAFRLRRAGPTTIAAAGTLEALVTQTCVVALEPFEQPVIEEFAVEFVPEGTATDDPDPDAVDQIPYSGRTIDLGEAAAEQLALVLDPYPHGPEASDAVLPAEGEGQFAALAALHPKH